MKKYDELDIEKEMIFPGSSTECQMQKQSEEDALGISSQYHDRFTPFCNIEPPSISNSPDAHLDDLLLYYKRKSCRVIGNLLFFYTMVQNLFKHAEKLVRTL